MTKVLKMDEAKTKELFNNIFGNILDDFGQPETELEKLINGLSFKVEWCGQCGGLFVECPRCGNNSCNGGYGEDGKCPVCPVTYEMMHAIEKLNHGSVSQMEAPKE